MQALMVKVRDHVVNVQAVADAHWDKGDLFVHFQGGGFARLRYEYVILLTKP